MEKPLVKAGVCLFGAAALVCPAVAETAAPSMTFMSLPAVAQTDAPAAPMWARHKDTMVIVVKDAAQCGQRARAARFALHDGVLQLEYALPAAPGAAQDCVGTQIFALKNLPDAPIRVAANARTEPVMAAQATAQPRAPVVSFMGVAAAPVGNLEQGWMYQQRDRDTALIIAREPAECGQKPVAPWLEARDGQVIVGYQLPVSMKPDVVQDCASTAIFTVRNLADAGSKLSVDTRLKALEAMAEPPAETAYEMRFTSVPAFAMNEAGDQRIVHRKVSDKAVVIVRDRANCGERPTDPSFTLRDGVLQLQYSLPAQEVASQPGAACASAAIFTFRNLSDGELRVAANAVRGSVARAPAPDLATQSTAPGKPILEADADQ